MPLEAARNPQKKKTVIIETKDELIDFAIYIGCLRLVICLVNCVFGCAFIFNNTSSYIFYRFSFNTEQAHYQHSTIHYFEN